MSLVLPNIIEKVLNHVNNKKINILKFIRNNSFFFEILLLNNTMNNQTIQKSNRDMSSNLKNITNNKVSDLFFSNSNLQIIQNAIRHNIWLRSNKQFVIGNQSETQLEIVMRSIYLQYSKNQDNNIKEQILRLNELVLKHCIPNILSNIKQYLTYKKDLTTGPILMDHPKNVSSAGSKTLKNNFF